MRTQTSKGPAASEEADANVPCSLTLWSTGSRPRTGASPRSAREEGELRAVTERHRESDAARKDVEAPARHDAARRKIGPAA